jgi:uncharacterized protein (TIGR00297 family)
LSERDLFLGGLVAAVVALVAARVKALTRDGAVAAFFVGALTYGAGTVGTTLLLLAFFLTAVALSRSGKARKSALADTAKGGPRDARQVVANGGIATACILVWALLDHGSSLTVWFVAFAGAYAAATADTWGTEIGTLAARPPRSIVTGRVLATGLSGGVSAPGTAAELAGAVLIAVLAPLALLLALPGTPVGVHALAGLVFPVFIGGFGGALVDSLLGATLQARRWCPSCERECETTLHGCGTATNHHRGLVWLDNDAVNLAATAAGAAIAAGAWLALAGLR